MSKTSGNPSAQENTADDVTMIRATNREIATILHALRVFQLGHHEIPVCDHFEDYSPLTPEEIDTLCESINFSASHFGGAQ